jgi:prepilin-type N-terminal cleavage/methylation domain-containing protein
MRQRGFSLLELLILVAVAGVVAAVVVPLLLRSRIAANQSAAVADVKTVVAAQAAYASVNQRYYDGELSCLNVPWTCIPNYPTSGPTFLDSALAALLPRSGYGRALHLGAPPPVIPASTSSTSRIGYAYLATPLNQGQTGVLGFAADASGRMCWTPDGSPVQERVPGELDPGCRSLD